MLKQKAEIVIDENTRLHEQIIGDIEDQLANNSEGQRSLTEVYQTLVLVILNRSHLPRFVYINLKSNDRFL